MTGRVFGIVPGRGLPRVHGERMRCQESVMGEVVVAVSDVDDGLNERLDDEIYHVAEIFFG